MIANSNDDITHLELFSYNYECRIGGILREFRVQAEKGEITWEEADSLQANYYDFYRQNRNDDSLKVNPYMTSWRSFSTPTINALEIWTSPFTSPMVPKMWDVPTRI